MDTVHLDESLVLDFCEGFFGYGSFKAPIWFVGMEEGGGESAEEIQRRLKIWDQRGRQKLENIREYHNEICIHRWFKDPLKRQRTWAGLILVMFGIKGQPFSSSLLLNYQKERLASSNGSECLIELLPLPSKSIGDWLYKAHLTLDHLTRRSAYRSYYSEPRALAIRKFVEKEMPKLVIFYSKDQKYRKFWDSVARVPFVPTLIEEVAPAETETTLFASMPHPSRPSRPDQYFWDVGNLIGAQIKCFVSKD